MKKTLGTIGTIGLAMALTACSSGPTDLEELYETCGSPYSFTVDDNGRVLTVQDTLDAVDIYCLLNGIDAPDWIYVKLGNTTTLDGWQEGRFDNFHIEWQYHHEYGASFIVKQN